MDKVEILKQIMKFTGNSYSKLADKMGFGSKQAVFNRLNTKKIDIDLFCDVVESMGGTVRVSVPNPKSGNASLEVVMHPSSDYSRHAGAEDLTAFVRDKMLNGNSGAKRTPAEIQEPDIYELTKQGFAVAAGTPSKKVARELEKEKARKKQALIEERKHKAEEMLKAQRVAAEKRARQEARAQELARKRIAKLEAQIKAEKDAEEKLLAKFHGDLSPAELDLRLPPEVEKSFFAKKEIVGAPKELGESSFSPESDTPISSQAIQKKKPAMLNAIPTVIEQSQPTTASSPEQDILNARPSDTPKPESEPSLADTALADMLSKFN